MQTEIIPDDHITLRRRLLLLLSMTILPLTFSCQERETPYTTWTAYNGDTGSSSYSALDQINRDTVEDLEVAWIYDSGDQDDIDFAFAASQANPIIIGRTLYITTPALKVVAIDAGTGEELWRFDPFRDGRRSEEHTSELQSRGHLVCRLLLEKKNRQA